MERLTDEERRQRENVEQYGPTRGDWQRMALAAVLEPLVRLATLALRGLSWILRR